MLNILYTSHPTIRLTIYICKLQINTSFHGLAIRLFPKIKDNKKILQLTMPALSSSLENLYGPSTS